VSDGDRTGDEPDGGRSERARDRGALDGGCADLAVFVGQLEVEHDHEQAELQACSLGQGSGSGGVEECGADFVGGGEEWFGAASDFVWGADAAESDVFVCVAVAGADWCSEFLY